MTDFIPFPKIPRLFRDATITEKIDGTNACVVVTDDGVLAQSRNQFITPLKDNHGFARWVYDNAERLRDTLGPGRHFGEWWGQGIQRGYGLVSKRFSLFNVSKWEGLVDDELGLFVVPVVARLSPFTTAGVQKAIIDLEQGGSVAAPGYEHPEGVVVFHEAGGHLYKALIENDDQPKGSLPKARREADLTSRVKFDAVAARPIFDEIVARVGTSDRAAFAAEALKSEHRAALFALLDGKV